MANAYDKDFLISVYLSRFYKVGDISILEANAIKFYDEVGRDKFRTYASVDAEAIREYYANGY